MPCQKDYYCIFAVPLVPAAVLTGCGKKVWILRFIFSNSNLSSREEFEKRYAAAVQLAQAENVELFADEYDHASWLERTISFADEPERGRRCAVCFDWSLSRTALAAAELGFDEFATSLTVSPHKSSKLIFEIGSRYERFSPWDFKKRDGFLKGNRRAKELELYRQQYCGCEFSYRDRFNQA